MFCTTLKTKVKALLTQFDSYVDSHVDLALQVTTAIKNVLASPVTDVLTAIIPGTLDDTIRTGLVNALTKVIDALTIADACKQYTDLNDKLSCFIQQIKQRDPQLQDALLQKLASLLSGELDGNRLKQSLYDLYTQAKYTTAK